MDIKNEYKQYTIDEDYPAALVANDYYLVKPDKLSNQTFIYNKGPCCNPRLLVKQPIKVLEEYGTDSTFIIDTGYEKHIFASKFLFTVLNTHNRIKQDKELDYLYMEIQGKKVPIIVSSSNEQINVIGLPFLSLFQCKINFLENKEYSIENFPSIF